MVLLPTDTIRLNILSGTNLRSADRNGFSDPYAVVFISPEQNIEFKTKKIKKTLNPVWNEEFTFSPTSHYCVISCYLYDWDMIGKDDPLGLVVFEISEEKFPVNKEHTIVKQVDDDEEGKAGQVTFKFTIERSQQEINKWKQMQLPPNFKFVDDNDLTFRAAVPYYFEFLADEYSNEKLKALVGCTKMEFQHVDDIFNVMRSQTNKSIEEVLLLHTRPFEMIYSDKSEDVICRKIDIHTHGPLLMEKFKQVVVADYYVGYGKNKVGHDVFSLSYFLVGMIEEGLFEIYHYWRHQSSHVNDHLTPEEEILIRNVAKHTQIKRFVSKKSPNP